MFKKKKREEKVDNSEQNSPLEEIRNFYYDDYDSVKYDGNTSNSNNNDYYINQDDKKSNYYDNDDYFTKSENILSKKKAISDNKSNRKISFLNKIIIIIVVSIVIVIGILIILNLTKTYNVTFDLNGDTKIYDAPSECKANIFGKCYVTLPNASRQNGEVLGYGLKSSDQEATYKVGEKVELKEDTKLYVISKAKKQLIIDSSSIDELEKIDLSCYAYNKENKCEVTVPKYNKKGYYNKGYSQKTDGKEITLFPGDKIELEEDKQYYPIYDQYYLRKKFTISDIAKSVELKKVYVDVTSSCSSTIGDKVINSIKIIEEKLPYVFGNNKVTLMSRSEFGRYTYYDSNVKGLTFGNEYNSVSVYVACEENEMDVYSVIFHELMHVFDAKTKYVLNKMFSDSTEIINAYNKYRYSGQSSMRSYAFSSRQEFFAELMTYYYFSYVDTTHTFVGIVDYRKNFPADLKALAEKYFCLGKNNYDEKMCS